MKYVIFSLCILIYIFLVPLSVFLKLLKIDLLSRKIEKNKKTYWNIDLNLSHDNKKDTI